MEQQSKGRVGPEAVSAEPAIPVVLPDVAAEPHPVSPPAGAGQGVLQDALPDITEVAKKVGGFKRLAEIAGQLSQAETGQ
jgi:hypothetical protein